MVAVVSPHDAPVAVDGNAATKKCIWEGKEGWGLNRFSVSEL